MPRPRSIRVSLMQQKERIDSLQNGMQTKRALFVEMSLALEGIQFCRGLLRVQPRLHPRRGSRSGVAGQAAIAFRLIVGPL